MSWYDNSRAAAERNIAALKETRTEILRTGDPIKITLFYVSERGLSSRKVVISSADEAKDLININERNLTSINKGNYRPLQQKGKRKR